MKKLSNSILLLLTLSLIITASANVSPTYASPTALSVEPSAIVGIEKTPGYLFSVNVSVTDVAGLFGFEFKLAYDPAILEVTGITLGSLFEEPIGEQPYGPVIEWHKEINKDLGYGWYAVSFGALSIYLETGISGSGILATVSFIVTGSGGTILDLVDTKLVDPLGNSIDHEVLPGLFNNLKSAPVAILEASLLTPEIDEIVAFAAQASYDPDPDGYIVSYYWDFGDGTAEYSYDRWGMPTPHSEHSWASIGVYTVRLTVTDDMGAQGRASVTIKVTPPRGLKADIVDAFPEFRNIKTVWPLEEDWWRRDTHFNPLYADVQSLTGESVTVKVRFTVIRPDGTQVTFDTSSYTFPAGSYLAEHRFNTATDCSPPQFETWVNGEWVIGPYSVQATAFYKVGNSWIEGRTRVFKFRVS